MDWRALSTPGIALEYNHLRTLPPEIGSLGSLQLLYLNANRLETLPETLRTLPLRELELESNPALGLPDSILDRPAEEILRYYFESRDEKGRPLLELKLLLVGRGGAGKTTLVKRLAGDEPDAHESETHSIAIRELTLEYSRGQVRTRAWDFGGQEILHATHQFFLTERSLYLLVLEPRSGLAQRDAEYWLKLIETQGGASPVIVALNWSHGRRWRVDEVRLRRKFPLSWLSCQPMPCTARALRHCVALSIRRSRNGCATCGCHSRGAGARSRMPSPGCATISSPSANTRTLRSVGRAGPGGTGRPGGDSPRPRAGVVFGKDPRLHDTRVLNPGWVTGGVYAVIRAPSVAANDGQLAVSDMPGVLRQAEELKVLKATDYPPETHGFILELMRAFQLCYASEEEQGKRGVISTGTAARIRARGGGAVGAGAGASTLSLRGTAAGAATAIHRPHPRVERRRAALAAWRGVASR